MEYLQLARTRENHVKVTRKNPQGQDRTMIFPVDFDDFCNRMERYNKGSEYIQDAFDNLSADEREFILTGITPEEWNEMFPDE